MVQNPGATSRDGHLRPLNLPQPVSILVEHGWPTAIVERGERICIDTIQDIWRIADEWWREPIQRHYYRLVLQNGQIRTIYHDVVHNNWHEQHY